MRRHRHITWGSVLWLAVLGVLASRAPQAQSQARKEPGPVFHPLVDLIAARVDSVLYAPWVRRLSGAEPVHVGGVPHTFTTRFSTSPQGRLAEQLVLERFTELGYDDVAYYPFLMSGTTVRNVIATLPGTEAPREVVILCGHLDSISPEPQSRAPGANDNATGVAAVLAAAEILRDYRFRATIRFIAFTGEEQGLFGSQHYALYGLSPEDSVVAVINLDMIGFWVDRWEIDLEGKTDADPIARVMEEACARYTDIGTNRSSANHIGDHLSFAQRGIPALLVLESDFSRDPCYHRTCDTADRSDVAFGTRVMRAVTATVAHLAGIQGDHASPGVDDDVEPVPPWVGPNPFTGPLVIRMPRDPGALREVSVHDVSGRRVRHLDLGDNAPYEIVWDGRTEDGESVPAGIYFVRIVDDGRPRVVKVVRVP